MRPRGHHHHHVYVVELDDRVWNEPRFRKANPDYRHAKHCVYLGMTGLDPDLRFDKHKAGAPGELALRLLTRRTLDCAGAAPEPATRAPLASAINDRFYRLSGLGRPLRRCASSCSSLNSTAPVASNRRLLRAPSLGDELSVDPPRRPGIQHLPRAPILEALEANDHLKVAGVSHNGGIGGLVPTRPVEENLSL